MRRYLLSVLACAVLLVGLAPAASAAAAGPDYVALGDSYAAGVGATPDGRSGDCARSDFSYPAQWAAAHHPASFADVACSGATSGTVLARQVRTVSRDTDLVTITVGGNDTGFGPVLSTCTRAVQDQTCLRAVHGGERIARFLVPGGLISTIVAAQLQAGKDVRIVVLGYPRLFAPGAACDVPGVPNAARRAALNQGADILNASLADAATRFGAHFVDVADRFAGHGVCSADPWINPPTDPPAAGIYHPTREGYTRGYLPALEGVART